MFKNARLRTALLLSLYGICALGPALSVAQQQLERVVITGSSIKRIDGETARPVQIITRQDIAKSDADTIEQVLQAVGAISSSGGLTTASMSSGPSAGISAVSLHGLTSLRTLVLLNGRRIAPYGIGGVNDSVSVDVNSIPLSAIERIEILKDGASAIYGSDAIAGVVNFILRSEYQGTELSAHVGGALDGGASARHVSATWGFGDMAKDRFNVMGSLQKETALFGRDRNFARSGINAGAQNDATTDVSFPANVLHLDANAM